MSTLCKQKHIPALYAIHILGGVSATARKFGVSRQVVWNWTKRGIPANKVPTLVELVDHQVSANELRSDIFGSGT
jgi:DNA-binding transcriptional regulator YdaS (Cro superfamily)